MKWSGAVELQQASSQGGGRPQSGAPSAVRLGGWTACGPELGGRGRGLGR